MKKAIVESGSVIQLMEKRWYLGDIHPGCPHFTPDGADKNETMLLHLVQGDNSAHRKIVAKHIFKDAPCRVVKGVAGVDAVELSAICPLQRRAPKQFRMDRVIVVKSTQPALDGLCEFAVLFGASQVVCSEQIVQPANFLAQPALFDLKRIRRHIDCTEDVEKAKNSCTEYEVDSSR